MITNYFIYILYGILKVVLYPLTYLNDVQTPTGLISSFQTSAGYVSVLSDIIPVTTLLTVIGLFVLIESYILGFKLISWIIKKIPFLN